MTEKKMAKDLGKCVYKKMYETMERGRELGYEFNANVLLVDCKDCTGYSSSCNVYVDTIKLAESIRKREEECRAKRIMKTGE